MVDKMKWELYKKSRKMSILYRWRIYEEVVDSYWTDMPGRETRFLWRMLDLGPNYTLDIHDTL